MLAILNSPFGSPGCPVEAEEDAEAVAGGCGLLLVSGEVGMLRTGSITFLEECGDLDDDAEDVGGICFC